MTFEEVLAEYEPMIRGIAARHARQERAIFDDLCQEARLAVWRVFAAGRVGRGDPRDRAFLRATITGVMQRFCRQNHPLHVSWRLGKIIDLPEVVQMCSLDTPLTETGLTLLDIVPAPEPNTAAADATTTIEDVVEDATAELSPALQHALARLSPVQRTVIAARYLGIGVEAMDSSSRKRHTRSIQKLRQMLDPAVLEPTG
jgi:RNA polymerase sigma factor (sigma-70 family)